MASSEIDSLPATEYHLIVSPALQVAAELAATRGDPDLYNDMASMLALMALVQGLADCYLRGQTNNAGAIQMAVEAAPVGACVMVLNRGELTQEQVNECVWALNAATRQLLESGVVGPERKLVEKAWMKLAEDDREEAGEWLKRAAAGIVSAIDQWEQSRGEE